MAVKSNEENKLNKRITPVTLHKLNAFFISLTVPDIFGMVNLTTKCVGFDGKQFTVNEFVKLTS